MTKLATDLLKYLPNYLFDFIHLISGPKRHIRAAQEENPDKAWTLGLRFALISFLLMFLLKYNSVSEDATFNAVLMRHGVWRLFEFAGSAAILLGVLKLFGIKQPSLQVLTIFSFFVGVGVVIAGVFEFCQFRALNFLAPEYASFLQKMGGVDNMNELKSLINDSRNSAANLGNADAAEIAMSVVQAISSVGSAVSWLWLILIWPLFLSDLPAMARLKKYGSMVAFAFADLMNPISFIAALVA